MINLLSDKINDLLNMDVNDIKKNMILQKKYLENNDFKKKNELLINICISLYINLNTEPTLKRDNKEIHHQ